MQNLFIYPVRVHIEDTDAYGVVYHTNYLNFMERARSEWFAEIGLGIAWQREHHVLFPICAVNIQFLKPARLHEKLEVVTTIKSLRPASILFYQYLRLASTPDKIICKAEIKIACVDTEMKTRAIPDSSTLDLLKGMIT